MNEPSPVEISDAPTGVPLDYAGPKTAGATWLIGPVRWLVVIVTLAVTLRVAYSIGLQRGSSVLPALPDQREYLDLGRYLMHGQGLMFEDPRFGQVVRAFRMPGYPALVAACGGSVPVVRAVQALLDGACCVAVFLIARRWLDDRTSLLAAALVAVHPFLFYFSSTILSESMFAVMLAWGIYAVLRPATKWRLYGIGLLTLSVYVRPSAIGLGIATAVLLYAMAPSRRPIRNAIVMGTFAAIGLIIVLLPWAIRNKIQVDRTIWTTTNSGFTAYDSFNPAADGSSNQAAFLGNVRLRDGDLRPYDVSWRVAPETEQLRFALRLRLMGEVGRSEFLSRAAWQYARENPGRVVSLAFAKLGRFWAPWPLSADFGGKWLYVVVGGAYTVPLFVFAAIGVWRGRMPWRVKLILLLPALYFSAVHSVFVGSLRYRVPCDVPLAVLAAAGVTSFVRPREIVPGDVV